MNYLKIIAYFLIITVAKNVAQPIDSIGRQMDTEAMTMTTTRPKLIIEETEPMMYYFITEHRPTSLGQNYYIKPGQLVGSFTLNSGSLQVRHEDNDGKPVASKQNILFVAYAKDMPQKNK
ncbi:hypothetical protein KR074_007331 [Drosophila pseudoananassae]|nr:hypothetical protein KR074_007331 [Drosophila pseudoananassae]